MFRLRTSALTFAAFVVLLSCARLGHAQSLPAPWSGVIARESDDPNQPWNTVHRTFKDAISGDGRFVVFKRGFEVNGPGDIFVRDRYTRDMRKVNVAWDGSEPYAPSDAASISSNGRHVVFLSCGRLTLDDVNDMCDLYVRDLEHDTITRVSRGPQGQEPAADVGYGSISNDGRFIAFTAEFFEPYPGLPRYAWLFDRDPDHNGIFDELGATTTTLVSLKADGTPASTDYTVAINGADARYVAFASMDPDVVPTPTGFGSHLYVRDLQNSVTFRVDRPTPGTADDGWSMWPDFSDDGRVLVYESTARVADTDFDSQDDVFMIDIWTGGNIELPLIGASGNNDRVILPTISGDGRYVAAAADLESTGPGKFYAWVYDRQMQQAMRLVPHAEGPYAEPSVLELSLNFDGSELLFWSEAYGVVHNYFPFGSNVFVWSPFSLSPSEQQVPATGGAFTAEVSVPPGIAWTATSPNSAWITIEPPTGNGPGFFTFTVPPNTTNEALTGYIWIGSEQIVVTQPAQPFIANVWPWAGPVTGGTVVSIDGGGFVSGATVTFDGVAAPSVNFVSGSLLEAVTPPQPRSGPVEVRVTNPDGLDAARLPGFRYMDDSPPVVEYVLEGPAGSNGYYLGDVTIRWNVSDPESDFTEQGCETRTLVEDALYYQFCQADSEGGSTVRWATVPRDTAGPFIDVYSPWYPPAQVPSRYPRGTSVTADYSCQDSFSGVASCVGDIPVGQDLDTSVAGTFTFNVHSDDVAGNHSTKAIPYIIVAPTALSLAGASGQHGGSASLIATLTSDGAPVAGRTITFSIGASSVGTAVTGANGVATLALSLDSLPADLYPTHATFEEGDVYAASDATATLNVTKITPSIAWTASADIVYPTALSGAQLNASANVPGAFSYLPPLGTIPSAGTHTLTATFTPADTVNYSVAFAETTVHVIKAPVTLTWTPPAPISYGTPLSGPQLNASANVPGSFTYTPPAGTVLNAGTQVLHVVFTPNDSNYESATADVSLVVTRATPVVTWATPAPIGYGTVLSATQLNASASVPGMFVYTPASGSALAAGSHVLAVNFVPADSVNYENASGSVQLSVTLAPLTIQTNAASKVYGAPLPAFSVSAAGFVFGETIASLSGSLSFSTSATSASAPGTYPVTPGGLTSSNYSISFVPGVMTVTKATTTLTLTSSPNPSTNNKPVVLTAQISVVPPGSGTPTGTVTFRENNTVLGTASIVNGVATLTVNFRKGTHPLTASWNGDANFVGSSGAAPHQVN